MPNNVGGMPTDTITFITARGRDAAAAAKSLRQLAVSKALMVQQAASAIKCQEWQTDGRGEFESRSGSNKPTFRVYGRNNEEEETVHKGGGL